MITGEVDPDGVPLVVLPLAGGLWRAVIDTGFNSDLELPLALKSELECVIAGFVISNLAAGQRIEEEGYVVKFPFDGEVVDADTTFVDGTEILIGTHLLRNHALTIDFPAGDVRIERSAPN